MQPPPILQITIERLRPGAEAAYGDIERRMARACERLGCPNAYLALESVTGATEVWWLVEYTDDDDFERVARAYAANEPLLAALGDLAAAKKDIVEPPVEHMTRLSAGAARDWHIGIEPFVVVAPHAADGVVFASADGALFTVAAARSGRAAAHAVGALGGDARVFRVQPAWSRPKQSWVDANSKLWRSAEGVHR